MSTIGTQLNWGASRRQRFYRRFLRRAAPSANTSWSRRP
jgi:hypothetical protein